jgi:hypothetical protein
MVEDDSSMSVDVDILKACLDKETYDQHKDLLKSYMLTPVGWGLLGDIGRYYEVYKDPVVNEKEFRIWFRITAYPGWKSEKHAIYSSIFDTLFDGSSVSSAILDSIARHRIVESMKSALSTNDIKRLEELQADLSKYNGKDSKAIKVNTKTVEDVVAEAIRFGGLKWRLHDLNKAVGPLNKGDLVIVGKRPETGGTSFMLSEFTNMIGQLPEGKHALIINNEEAETKLIIRLVCAALGVPASAVYGDPSKHNSDYIKFLAGRRIDLVSDGAVSIYDIERILSTGDYGLIGLNVLEKLDGVSRKLEDYQRLEKLGQWARKQALLHGPVMAIVQADTSATGVMYPTMDMLYKSKTGLQGEADLLLMIGKSLDPSYDHLRYIHAAKNKLPGDTHTDPRLRHIQSEVAFDIETGRFTSISWKGK